MIGSWHFGKVLRFLGILAAGTGVAQSYGAVEVSRRKIDQTLK
jgi:hypothetical protein